MLSLSIAWGGVSGKIVITGFMREKKKKLFKAILRVCLEQLKGETWELFEKENLEDLGPPWKCGWDDRLQWNVGFQDSWCARKIVNVQCVSYRYASADGCLLKAPGAWPPNSRMFTILFFLLFLLLNERGGGEDKLKKNKQQKLHSGRCWKKEMLHSCPCPPPQICLCFICRELQLRTLPKPTPPWRFQSAAGSFWHSCQGGVLLCLIKGCYWNKTKKKCFFPFHVICNKTTLWSLNELSQLRKIQTIFIISECLQFIPFLWKEDMQQ